VPDDMSQRLTAVAAAGGVCCRGVCCTAAAVVVVHRERRVHRGVSYVSPLPRSTARRACRGSVCQCVCVCVCVCACACARAWSTTLQASLSECVTACACRCRGVLYVMSLHDAPTVVVCADTGTAAVPSRHRGRQRHVRRAGGSGECRRHARWQEWRQHRGGASCRCAGAG
jgi:hypothetical protein